MKKMVGVIIYGLLMLNFIGYADADNDVIAIWHFDEGKGAVIKDSSPNGNDGVVVGAQWVKEGKKGFALEFDGVDDHVLIVPRANLNLTESCTIEAWVRFYFSKFPGDNGGIVSKVDDAGGKSTGYFFFGRKDKKVYFTLGYGTGFRWFGTKSELEEGEWYHVAVTYDGNKAKIYINGKVDSEFEVGAKIAGNDLPVLIGAEKVGQHHFCGMIDEVKIYNRALTEDEVKEEHRTHFRGEASEKKDVERIRKTDFAKKESLKILSILPNREQVPKSELFELNINLSATYDNPFDKEDIEVKAVFTSPSDKTIIIPTFFYQDYEMITILSKERLSQVDWLNFNIFGRDRWISEKDINLYFDGIELINSWTGKSFPIGDGEEIEKWSSVGCRVDAEKSIKKEGANSLRLTIYPQKEERSPYIIRTFENSDWSEYDKLSFWFYPETVPTAPGYPPEMNLAFHSRKTGDNIWRRFQELRAKEWHHYIVNLDLIPPTTRLEKKGEPFWKVRFTPTEVGEYKYYLLAKDRTGEVKSEVMTFNSLPSENPGFVRVSKEAPHSFQFDNGKPYFAIGWNGYLNYGECIGIGPEDFTAQSRYFKILTENNANFIRLYPWRFFTDFMDGVKRYNLQTLWELDYILEEAEKRGIYVMYTSNCHRFWGSHLSWPENPYNEKNGGPCVKPTDFLTNEEAINSYKKFLNYLITRYSAYTSLFAWELFNEFNMWNGGDSGTEILKHCKVEDIMGWHKEMAGYLHANDPYNHLVSTSFSQGDEGPLGASSIWQLPEIDFVQTHWYDPRIENTIPNVCYKKLDKYPKPHIVGEFMSHGTEAPSTTFNRDPEGIVFHNVIWSSAHTGSTALVFCPPYIDTANLYYHFKALGDFLKDVPWTKSIFQKVKVDFPWEKLNIIGFQSDALTLLWIQNKEHTRISRDQGKTVPPVPEGETISINGLKEGEYLIELWDTYQGRIIRKEKEYANDSKLLLKLPAIEKDIACKIYLQ